ncbi:hypothetical protein IT575_01430 [bacterium]|nr:hypothetical protein [bacterium]
MSALLALTSCGGGGKSAEPGAEDAGFKLAALAQSQPGLGSAQFGLEEPRQNGQGAELVVMVRSAQSLRAASLELRFDAQRYRLKDVAWNAAPAGADKAFNLTLADPRDPGRIELGFVLQDALAQPGFNGAGELCRLRFSSLSNREAKAAVKPVAGSPPALSRAASTPPRNPGSAASVELDAPGETLSWYYSLAGDYDQNGIVAVQDLSSVGIHYDPQHSGAYDPASIEAQVDGNRDGRISVQDLTPIGSNFQTRATGYNIYRSAQQSDYPAAHDAPDIQSPIANVNFPGADSASGARLHWTVPLGPVAAGDNFWVRLLDDGAVGDAKLGALSPSQPDDWDVDDVPPPPQGLPAFPGAEGFGAYASGGRGGQVIYVTSLNTSGPGSLQAALDTPGPKYILFKVSGVIEGAVTMTRGDVTLAGQTSPGGIIVRGFICDPEPYVEDDDTGIESWPENFILRHLRSRPDFEAGSGSPSDDGLRLHHAVNGIIDHFSIANAADEAVQISWSRDITIQDCIFAETLGDHAYLGGMLINYSNPTDGWPLTRLSIHHNCWNRIMGRMPELSRESPNAAGSVMELELSNNLLWDPGINIQVAPNRGQLDGQPVYYALNWVGNRAIGRASFPEPTAQAPGWSFGLMSADFLQLSPEDNSVFISGNINDSFPGFTDYQQLYCCNDYDQQVTNDPGGLPFPSNLMPGPFAREQRHDFPAISYTPAAQLVDHIHAHVGARPTDPMDRRLLQALSDSVIDPARRDVKHPANDTFSFDWLPGAPPEAPLDSDSDGMPDQWEQDNGLNPSVQDHNGLGLSLQFSGVEGYTNLECYLNELADLLEH